MGEGLWVSAQPRRAYLGALTGSLELSRPPKQGTPLVILIFPPRRNRLLALSHAAEIWIQNLLKCQPPKFEAAGCSA